MMSDLAETWSKANGNRFALELVFLFIYFRKFDHFDFFEKNAFFSARVSSLFQKLYWKTRP